MEDQGSKTDENGDDKERKSINNDGISIDYGTQKEFTLDDSGGVDGVNSFEDLLEIIGPSGHWNIRTLLICCMSPFVLPFQAITYQFLGATPDYWCHVDELVNANWTQQQITSLAIPSLNNGTDKESCKIFDYNYTAAVELGYEFASENLNSLHINNDNQTSIVPCYSRDYNTSQYHSTLVTEFDLVCERRALYSTTQASSQFGTLLGALIGGYLMDMYGRRPVIIWGVFLSLIAGLGAAVAPVFPLFIVLKTLVSCFNYAYFTGCFVYLMEICSPSQRSSVGSIGGLPWTIGYMIVPGIAYLIRPWRWLQMTYSFPVIAYFAYYWLLPESPRWLISQGRYEDAITVLSTAAKLNGRSLPPSEALTISMKKMTPPKEKTPKKSLSRRIIDSIKHFFILIIKPEFRVQMLVCYFCWCAVSMVYYGISLSSGNLSTDPYMYVFLGGVAELPSYFLMWPMVVYMGRRITLMSLFLVSGITIATIAIILATQDEVSMGLLMFLSMIGKIAITEAFHVVYVYTAELFPTRYRTLAVGESSMMARVGSISSPYINDILGESIPWGPTALFALMSFLASGLSLFLPETRDAITEEECNETQKKDGDGIQLQNQAKSNDAFEAN